MINYLDFEKPLAEIEGKAEELRAMARASDEMDVAEEAAALDRKAREMLGMEFIPADQAVRDAAAFLIERGHVT